MDVLLIKIISILLLLAACQMALKFIPESGPGLLDLQAGPLNHQKTILLVWTLPAIVAVLCGPAFLAPGRTLLCFFLFLPFCQDLLTFRFDWRIWSALLLLFIILFAALNPLSIKERLWGLLWAAFLLPFVLARTMGTADFWFMAVFGFLLGFERAAILLFLAIVFGLLYGLFMIQKNGSCPLIPFVSCLCAAFAPAFFHGYGLWYGLLKCFSF